MNKYINYFFFYMNKKISIGIRPLSGRNFSGKICVHHKSGGNKKQYLNIDFFRRINSFAHIYKIIKSSNRTSLIAGVIYENGLFSYLSLTESLKIGDKIYSGIFNKIIDNLGSTYLLKDIKLFTIIHNIELYPYQGFSLVRSAGSKAILTKIERGKVTLKLKSGWNMNLSQKCLAILGQVSNKNHKFDIIGKAGKSRALGKRPSVRGVAMNPCDHPHGGGEGKKSPPSGQRSPWGWLTKGTPTLKKLYNKRKKKLYKDIKN